MKFPPGFDFYLEYFIYLFYYAEKMASKVTKSYTQVLGNARTEVV